MRTKIKRLLRRHRNKLPAPVPARPNGSGGDPVDRLNYRATWARECAAAVDRVGTD